MFNKITLAILAIGSVTLIALLLAEAPDEHAFATLPNEANIPSKVAQTSTTGSESPQENKPALFQMISTNTAQAAPSDSEQQSATPLNQNDPIARIRAIQEKTALQQALVEEHEQFTRYAPNNRRIEAPEQDPLAQRYAIDERTTIDEETGYSLTIWTDKKYYLHGDTVEVYASLKDENGQAIPAEFMGQLIFNETNNIDSFSFSDASRSGTYQHQITLGGSDQTALSAGLYKILVVNNQSELADSATFILSKPDIELTGNFREHIDAQGNLLIETQVRVHSSNRYYAQASLYSVNDEPIGSSETAGELEPGEHWLALSYDGQLFRDADTAGPYRLKHFSLAKVSLPIQRAPLKAPEFTTQPYTLDEFVVANN